MTMRQRARAMRADGVSFSKIAAELGTHLSTVYRHAGDVAAFPRATSRTIVRRFAHNGGCSTLSGMVPVSLPRIEALHGRAA